jgi:hypothetical protein
MTLTEDGLRCSLVLMQLAKHIEISIPVLTLDRMKKRGNLLSGKTLFVRARPLVLNTYYYYQHRPEFNLTQPSSNKIARPV